VRSVFLFESILSITRFGIVGGEADPLRKIR
jgi:hypothetical protein